MIQDSGHLAPHLLVDVAVAEREQRLQALALLLRLAPLLPDIVLRAAHAAPSDGGAHLGGHAAVAALLGAQDRLKEVLHRVGRGVRAPVAVALKSVPPQQPLPPRLLREVELQGVHVGGVHFEPGQYALRGARRQLRPREPEGAVRSARVVEEGRVDVDSRRARHHVVAFVRIQLGDGNGVVLDNAKQVGEPPLVQAGGNLVALRQRPQDRIPPLHLLGQQPTAPLLQPPQPLIELALLNPAREAPHEEAHSPRVLLKCVLSQELAFF
mmetsp:Transcript_23635/g.51597  ORF Transcript_23635/g.51597 Transcript_23635/m.51597 type:complete len:268 (+) Transcript_23635:703-1506(+)|eukprot:CAMPEP_0118953428 /NCGR_PEP_ID=MMETSP1169-20130426/56537_1 /TAXON_ID=36882 /ORGANISM="Pyramimonas obovata, Strain CCMP722" /LENGTH=267 /DNA_ID=CAMNT_0006900873 /DNA_START=682 /DNA_END=1485 /DNA_ORIENTATION=+